MMHFIFVDDGECFRTGEIVQTVAEEYYLVQFDDMSGEGTLMPAEMVYLAEMCETCQHGIKRWKFFKTAEARKAWWDVIDTPSSSARPKIVSINDKPVGEA